MPLKYIIYKIEVTQNAGFTSPTVCIALPGSPDYGAETLGAGADGECASRVC